MTCTASGCVGAGRAADRAVLLEPERTGTRAFAKRYAVLMPDNVPGSVHAGQYSAVMHYLKGVAAVGPEKAKADGLAVIEQMKAHPTDDPLFGKGLVRMDGRVIHDMHLFEVKSPAESKEPFDYYIPKRVVPAAEAFRPLSQGGCPLVKA